MGDVWIPPRLHQVHDLHAAPLFVEVFGDEAAVAMLGCLFTAEQAGAVEELRRYGLLDAPFHHQQSELLFVQLPIAFLLLEGIENRFGRRELGEVDIVHGADGLHEVTQVVALAEAGELRAVVQADVGQAAGAGVLQQREELLGGFFGEADGEEFHAVS